MACLGYLALQILPRNVAVIQTISSKYFVP